MHTPRGLASIPLNKWGMWVVWIVIILAVLLGGGYWGYKAYDKKFNVEYDNNPPAVELEEAVSESSGTTDWKTYRNEKYGFLFRYPPTITFSEQQGDGWLIVHLVGLDYELYLQTGSKQSPLPSVSLFKEESISLAGYTFQEGSALQQDNPRLGLEEGTQWIQFTGVPMLSIFGWLQESRQEGIVNEIYLTLNTIQM